MWHVGFRKRTLSTERRSLDDSGLDATEEDPRRRGGPFRVRKAASEVWQAEHKERPWLGDKHYNFRGRS